MLDTVLNLFFYSTITNLVCSKVLGMEINITIGKQNKKTTL